jgi:hypothetical protein
MARALPLPRLRQAVVNDTGAVSAAMWQLPVSESMQHPRSQRRGLRKCGACLLAALLAAPQASAAVWTARDLGSMATEAACMETAMQSMEAFANFFGAEALSRGDWLVALDGIQGKPVHALITCTHDAHRTRATLVIWSAENTFTRLFAADRLRQLWDEAAEAAR